MNDITPTCPACHRALDEGFLLDETHGGRHPLFWVEGPPERSRLFGTKLKGRAIWRVTTYRCPDCGYLSSYARHPHKG